MDQHRQILVIIKGQGILEATELCQPSSHDDVHVGCGLPRNEKGISSCQELVVNRVVGQSVYCNTRDNAKSRKEWVDRKVRHANLASDQKGARTSDNQTNVLILFKRVAFEFAPELLRQEG